jgi:hypothetical protein
MLQDLKNHNEPWQQVGANLLRSGFADRRLPCISSNIIPSLIPEEALRREMQELNKQAESIMAGKSQGEEGFCNGLLLIAPQTVRDNGTVLKQPRLKLNK